MYTYLYVSKSLLTLLFISLYLSPLLDLSFEKHLIEPPTTMFEIFTFPFILWIKNAVKIWVKKLTLYHLQVPAQTAVDSFYYIGSYKWTTY